MEEKTLFEDFTTLRWVSWMKRKPKSNGFFRVRWNGKYTSESHILNGKIYSLDGELTKTVLTKSGKTTIKYSAAQKKILKDLYWLEEIHDLKGFREYQDKITKEFLKNQK